MKRKIFNQFVLIISKRFGLTQEELFERSKKLLVVHARQLLFYMCYEKRNMRYGELQEYVIDCGLDLNTSSIRNGVQKIRELAKKDQDYKIIIDNINNQIQVQ